jgi:hypothetical protein
MTVLLTFPFRLEGGSAVVADDASEIYLGDELAQLIQTQPGERELVPGFGLNDPAYTVFDVSMLEAQIDQFEMPLVIDDVGTRYLDDTTQDVLVSFHPDPTLYASTSPVGARTTDDTEETEAV